MDSHEYETLPYVFYIIKKNYNTAISANVSLYGKIQKATLY